MTLEAVQDGNIGNLNLPPPQTQHIYDYIILKVAWNQNSQSNILKMNKTSYHNLWFQTEVQSYSSKKQKQKCVLLQ